MRYSASLGVIRYSASHSMMRYSASHGMMRYIASHGVMLTRSATATPAITTHRTLLQGRVAGTRH
jgi:hypothetical protein